MHTWANDILDTIEKMVAAKNPDRFKICTVKSIQPLVFVWNEVEIGAEFGDTVYIHPLFLPPLIEQDENTLSEIQQFKSTTAYNSPNFEGIIEGSIPAFLKEFYLFYKNWQSTFVLSPNDLILVLEYGEGCYIVLQKLVKDTLDKIKEKEQ